MSNEISKNVAAMGLSQKPDFLPDGEVKGLDDAKQFMRPPRLKFIQALTKSPLRDEFNEGDLVLLPQAVLVRPILLNAKGKPEKAGQMFKFIPIMFYPEWVCWNPREVTTLPAVRDRTTDIKSPISVKARNKNTWFEQCPESPEYSLRYQEHLNFLVMMLNDTEPNIAAGVPAVMSFTRSEHKRGSAFLSLIELRRASIFDCQFVGRAGYRENEQGHWYGFDISNPNPETDGFGPWVESKEMHDTLEALHDEYKEAYENSKLITDYDEELEVDAAASSAEF